MEKLYFRQLLAGRDFAQDDPAATSMENFVYLIGDKEKKLCVAVDPAWNVHDIVNVAKNDGMKIIGALATHYHPDHVGGHAYGHDVEGLAELMAINPCPIHAHRLEKDGIIKITGLEAKDIVAHDSGDVVMAGDISIEILHTPGHTPGSCCFRIKNALVSGDTLFLRGCGRVDLPGGDVDEMYKTIHQRFKTISDETMIYPGHAYGGEHEEMQSLRANNHIFKHIDATSFKRLFIR